MSGRRPEAESFGAADAPALPMAAAVQVQPAPRLQLAPLFRRLFYTLLLPVAIALLLDLLLGTLPWITLIAALLCIPLASLVVGKAVLSDLDRVLAIVAPLPPPPAVDETGGAPAERPAEQASSAGEPGDGQSAADAPGAEAHALP